MAARKRLFHEEEVKAKIRTSQLINRLNSFVMGEIELSPAQVTAALGLIKKRLPDLAATDMTVQGTIGQYAAQPIPVEQRQSDSLESAAGAATNGDTARPH